jgi:hypothetical protein
MNKIEGAILFTDNIFIIAYPNYTDLIFFYGQHFINACDVLKNVFREGL